MADEECASNRTSVGVGKTSTQELSVVIVIIVIHSTIECEQNHLWNLKAQKRRIISAKMPPEKWKRCGDIHNDVDNFSYVSSVWCDDFMIYHEIYPLERS